MCSQLVTYRRISNIHLCEEQAKCTLALGTPQTRSRDEVLQPTEIKTDKVFSKRQNNCV